MRALIVYYSRTGITEKSCKAIADALKANDTVEVQVEELIDLTDRSGMVGWLSGGRDATLKKPTEIEPVKVDVASFDLVVIGTPVWAFTCAPAPRAFCEQFAEDLDTVAFVVTMGGAGDKGAYEAMEGYCGATPVATLTLIDKHVKTDSPEKFIGPVGSFAQVLREEAGG